MKSHLNKLSRLQGAGALPFADELLPFAEQAAREALEALSPTRCAGCERAGALICQDCLAALTLIDPRHSCTRCGAPFGDLLCTECSVEGTSSAMAEALDRCLARCRELFDWDTKFPVRDMGGGKVRAAGMAMSMQGSGISGVDVGSVTVKLNDDGTFMLLIGAADMGTGCDTILAQMVAEHMDCSVDDVSVFGADTDASPYDSGSYASSTTYITGMAVQKACDKLKGNLCAIAAMVLDCSADELAFEDGRVVRQATGQAVELAAIAQRSQSFCDIPAEATASHTSPVSPPPFMVGMVEIELDRETGVVEVLDYVSVVDCGLPINPALARIQAEGGIVQGIGHTLLEDVTHTKAGAMRESSFFTYRLPTRLDVGRIRVEFEQSCEPTGPFGAKSIGEIVINTPAPALAQAIYRATGVWHRELPILPEHILLAKAGQ